MDGYCEEYKDQEVKVNEEEKRITHPSGAQKGSKTTRIDLIPQKALAELGYHFGKGSEKYPPDENGLENWRKGYAFSSSVAALERHLNQFMQGEDYDEETGSKHIISVAWHAMVLATFMDEHPELDDRQSVLAKRYLEENNVFEKESNEATNFIANPQRTFVNDNLEIKKSHVRCPARFNDVSGRTFTCDIANFNHKDSAKHFDLEMGWWFI